MTPEPVYVIGVSVDDPERLCQVARETIDRADELWGSERLLAMWPGARQNIVVLGKGLVTALQGLIHRSPDCRVVILASGDPGFYGVAASLLKILPVEEVRIIPQVSCLQTAFARVRVPWNDAAFTSVHARPVAEVIGLARRSPKVGILTDPVQSPAWIAEKLVAAGIPDCRAVVLENLGEPDEKITDTRLAALPEMQFAPLNVLLLLHDRVWRPLPTLSFRPDSAYRHKNGMITKSDVRIISIGRMMLRETDIVWDIGAGSGAVSIEMAEMAWRGKVIAVEKDAECLDCLRENVARFGVMNLEIIAGVAPQVLADLPVPNAVFIGGSSGRLEDILGQIERSARGGCRIVANFTILENLLQTQRWMQEHGWEPTLTEAQFSYGAPIGGGTRLTPVNPVFIICGTIPDKEIS